ncbi:MAG: bifunctional riboflavin kinase/FAD synthetase [Gammaproteobacteria bacterium]|nr:bifunctional riboflavin kinase/FAD synthetase [Gammaproteobacteria bacterium]NNC97672.1 bifunctional riboflavin kinase/FAD synthetase [Gammaproteobacteria bacterium]NNM12848.1 bifunctional riboflavin kinase/FAD synthetase [Gammaproteobacteria bacterium]
MRLIRSYKNFPKELSGSVLTIGNYDGVHLGHQRVIERVLQVAKLKHLHSLVMVFEPTPKEYFMGDQAPARLMRWRDRFLAIKQTGCEGLVQLKFDRELSSLSANDFVKQILVDALGVQHVVIGDDFRYGYQRQGDFEHLKDAGREHGFIVEDTQTLKQGTQRVSSSAIRAALSDGDMELASSLLGSAYHMSGRVVHGKKLGRELGFPTLNIPVSRQISPLHGIYAVQVHGLEQDPVNGIASIGTRPAVEGSDWILEVHLLERDGDFYGQHVDVEFLHFLRPEINFADLAALKKQMQADLEQVREYFEH